MLDCHACKRDKVTPAKNDQSFWKDSVRQCQLKAERATPICRDCNLRGAAAQWRRRSVASSTWGCGCGAGGCGIASRGVLDLEV